jgi:hypothetical protein
MPGHPATKISPISTALPVCSPNLMPFHIKYSGLAPISTYFRVNPAPCVNGDADSREGVAPNCRVDKEERFVAAFRGRTVHGLRVDLPEGYGGIILRTAEEASGDESCRMEVDGAEDEVDPEEHVSSRTLKPTETFASFVLWQPDHRVDEGKDEYYRSLTEWTQLTAQVWY